MNFNPNNPATYKPARKKQYDIHMGLPALEAVFCNKFEQPQVAARLPFQPDRCLLTGRDVYHLQNTHARDLMRQESMHGLNSGLHKACCIQRHQRQRIE